MMMCAVVSAFAAMAFFCLWRRALIGKRLADVGVKTITVAIVEDHKVIADGLERLAHESGLVRVVGKAHTVVACWRMLVQESHPDVLILGIALPDGNGLDLCSEIKRKYPQLKIVLLTAYRAPAVIGRALDAGVDGYVFKNAGWEELLAGIRVAASGQRFLCEEVNALVNDSKSVSLQLTRREMELLHLIADGLTLPEQANKMCLGINTIRSYRKTLNYKLDAHNTAQLLQNARAMTLI
ncbi:MAG: response regulator transcription factor [Mediterranea sp.]|nr:response regulator transcription factor [Mediterranea sp.]